MKLTVSKRIIFSAIMMASAISPALALDYEAKPVKWVLLAPVRLVGGVSGALVSGSVFGPIHDGYHWSVKGTKHVAGKFGDEAGTGQLIAAAPIGGSVGLVLGTAYGVPDGAIHGFKTGWDKPFSKWSYNNMEEKEK